MHSLYIVASAERIFFQINFDRQYVCMCVHDSQNVRDGPKWNYYGLIQTYMLPREWIFSIIKRE
jgi:hypothetical protein